jgi:hypothetical protein
MEWVFIYFGRWGQEVTKELETSRKAATWKMEKEIGE